MIQFHRRRLSPPPLGGQLPGEANFVRTVPESFSDQHSQGRSFEDSPIFSIEAALLSMADGRCAAATVFGILDEEYERVEGWLERLEDEEDPKYQAFSELLEAMEVLSEALERDDGTGLHRGFRQLQKAHQSAAKLFPSA